MILVQRFLISSFRNNMTDDIQINWRLSLIELFEFLLSSLDNIAINEEFSYMMF